MGRWHADAARRVGARVCAIVDENAGRAETLAARYRGCVAGTDLHRALRRHSGQVVHVCTSTASHEDLAAQVLQARCHAIVEKPIASTLAGARRLVEAAAAHGVLLCPCHQFMFQRGVHRARALLPNLGAVRQIDIVTCSAGADGRLDGERDAIALEMLPHPFSLLMRMLSHSPVGLEWQVLRPAPGELRLCGIGLGLTAGIVVSTHGRPVMNELRLIADLGTIRCDLFHGYLAVESRSVSRATKALRPFANGTTQLVAATVNAGHRLITREFAYPGLRDLVRRFYLAVATGDVSPIGVDETLAVAELSERIAARLHSS
jgi:predicted dehydrogenase